MTAAPAGLGRGTRLHRTVDDRKELLIRGGYVVTADPDLGDLPVGDVLVADGLISAVGPNLKTATASAEASRSGRPARHPGPGGHPPARVAGRHRRLHAADHRRRVRARRANRDLPEALTGRRLRRHAVGRPAGARRRDHHDRRLGTQRPVPGARGRGPARPAGLRHPRLLPLWRPRPRHRRPESAAPGGRPPPARSVLRFGPVRAAADGHGAPRTLLHHAPSATPRTSRSPATSGCRSRCTRAWQAPPPTRSPRRSATACWSRRQLRARQHHHRSGVRPHRRRARAP